MDAAKPALQVVDAVPAIQMTDQGTPRTSIASHRMVETPVGRYGANLGQLMKRCLHRFVDRRLGSDIGIGAEEDYRPCPS